MPDFEFKHRDGLALAAGEDDTTAVLRWLNGRALPVTVEEMLWLQQAAIPAALSVLAPIPTPRRRVPVGGQTTLLDP